ncbi:LysR family transcriptional regulator [Candidatus Bathyarchaeota archaeon]|jgi:molybdate transport repressor ModE-like protein|nr:LysR family transcriptional regulator [Candidatus Bathyarchaeota archaeon]
MIIMSRPRPAFKIWLETDKGYVFGPGVYRLLKSIQEKGTLKEASQSLEMSYRYAWGLIREAEERLGEPLIEASKGGRDGGGSTQITALGREFIEDFENLRDTLAQASVSQTVISENHVTGIIKDIQHDPDGVTITVQIGDVKAQFNRKELEFYEGDEVRFKLLLEQ